MPTLRVCVMTSLVLSGLAHALVVGKNSMPRTKRTTQEQDYHTLAMSA
jgi:hypothetical protein